MTEKHDFNENYSIPVLTLDHVSDHLSQHALIIL